MTTLTLARRASVPARRAGTSTARAIAQRGCDIATAAGLDAEPVPLAGGRPAIQICRAARRHEVDLIVCGTSRLLPGRETVVVHAGSGSLTAGEGAALARALGLRCTDETVEPGPDAPEALIAAAHRAGAPAVIVGSRGRGAVTSTLLGSFLTAVPREAALPVIANEST